MWKVNRKKKLRKKCSSGDRVTVVLVMVETRTLALSALSHSVQFSSVAQLSLTLCDPMKDSTPGLPVHHQLLEFT